MCEILRSQAAVIAKFAKFRRRSRLIFANFAMRAAWLRAISHTTPARHYIHGNIVFTGFRDKELMKKLEDLGAIISGNVSKKTFAVIYKDDDSTSNVEKAKEKGVTVYNIDEFKEKFPLP